MSKRNLSKSTAKPKIDNYGYNIDGVTKADEGKYEEALEYFTKAIEIDPGNFVSYFNRASIRMHFGDIEGARRDFKRSDTLAHTSIM